MVLIKFEAETLNDRIEPVTIATSLASLREADADFLEEMADHLYAIGKRRRREEARNGTSI